MHDGDDGDNDDDDDDDETRLIRFEESRTKANIQIMCKKILLSSSNVRFCQPFLNENISDFFYFLFIFILNI